MTYAGKYFDKLTEKVSFFGALQPHQSTEAMEPSDLQRPRKRVEFKPTYGPHPKPKTTDFNPFLVPGNLWTKDKLMEYFDCCRKEETEKFPKLLRIIDEYQMGHNISLKCEFEDAGGNVVTLWLPLTFTYHSKDYYTTWQAWKRYYDALWTPPGMILTRL